jgi:hypothetical protein
MKEVCYGFFKENILSKQLFDKSNSIVTEKGYQSNYPSTLMHQLVAAYDQCINAPLMT